MNAECETSQMRCAGLLSYSLRGTGLTLTVFPKIILEIAIVLSLEFDNQHEAESKGLALDSCSQIRRVLSPPWMGDKPSPILELILKPSGLVLQTMALSHCSQAFSQFQRNKAAAIRVEPIALDCKSIQKHSQLLRQATGSRALGK